MKRTLLIWASMACMTVHSVMAQDAAVNKIIEIGQTDNQVMDHLDVLTNRNSAGRVIGSNAYDNAVEWVASKFTEWGLEVELQEAGTLPVGFNRGPWFGKLLGENGMELHFVTPSYTAGTKGVQRGHVLQEPLTQSEFDRMKGQLKGAWVLIEREECRLAGRPFRQRRLHPCRHHFRKQRSGQKRTARSWRITGATIPTTRCCH